MVEGRMDHAVGRAGAAPQAVEIVERSAMNCGTGRGQRRGGGLRPGEAKHLVPRVEQLPDNR